MQAELEELRYRLAQAEQKLKDSESRMETLLAALDEGITIHDAEGAIIQSNHSAQRLLGLTQSQLEGKDPFDPRWQAVHEDGTPYPGNTHPPYLALTTGKQQLNQVMGLRHTDGSLVWVQINAVPLFDKEAGKITGIVTSFFDITVRKQTEEKFQLFKYLSDNANDALILVRKDGTFAYLNEAAKLRWGYDESEISSIKVPDINPNYTSKAFEELFEKAQQQQRITPFETLHRHKGGAVFPVELSMSAIVVNNEPHLFVVARDITKRKQTEEALAHQNYINKLITDNANLGFFMMDDQQRCTFMNPVAEQMTGFTFAEIQEKNLPLHNIIHYLHPDGSPYPLADCPIDRALPTRNREQGEDVFIKKDGSFYPVAFTASPIIRDGKAIGTVIEVRDTTEEKRTAEELRNLIQKKDEFLSIASHELKTPLTSIKAFNQLMSRTADPEKLNGFVTKSAEHILRLEKLISDLLDVTKINAGKLSYTMHPFDFCQMLTGSIESVQHMAPEHQITLESCEDAVYTGDRLRLEQVVNNFLTNAVKYSPGGGKILVNCKLVLDNLVVSVQDFGIGIEAENLNRIFERYYRVDNTAMRFEGLGLGLFISSEILKRHHGSFWIESEPKKGSTFYFRLPLAGKEDLDPSRDEQHFYQSKSITITYQEQHQRLDVDWTGFQSLASVQQGCLKMLDLLKANRVVKVVNDNRHVLGTWSEAAEWVGEEWFPMMEKAGLKYFAWIFSPSAFSQLSAKKSVDVKQGNVTTRFFTEVSEAEEWLRNH